MSFRIRSILGWGISNNKKIDLKKKVMASFCTSALAEKNQVNMILVIFVTRKYIVEKSNFMTELFFVAGCTCIYQILSVNLTKTNLCIVDFFSVYNNLKCFREEKVIRFKEIPL